MGRNDVPTRPSFMTSHTVWHRVICKSFCQLFDGRWDDCNRCRIVAAIKKSIIAVKKVMRYENAEEWAKWKLKSFTAIDRERTHTRIVCMDCDANNTVRGECERLRQEAKTHSQRLSQINCKLRTGACCMLQSMHDAVNIYMDTGRFFVSLQRSTVCRWRASRNAAFGFSRKW